MGSKTEIDVGDIWSIINNVFNGVSNTLTHQQYLGLFETNKLAIPEVRLWLAVLESVYIDWLEHKYCPSDRTKKNVTEIESWVYKDGLSMEMMGEAINAMIQLPYDRFKKKLYDWLSHNKPMLKSKAPESIVPIDVGALFDEVPKPNIDIGGDFIEYLIPND